MKHSLDPYHLKATRPRGSPPAGATIEGNLTSSSTNPRRQAARSGRPKGSGVTPPAQGGTTQGAPAQPQQLGHASQPRQPSSRAGPGHGSPSETATTAGSSRSPGHVRGLQVTADASLNGSTPAAATSTNPSAAGIRQQPTDPSRLPRVHFRAEAGSHQGRPTPPPAAAEAPRVVPASTPISTGDQAGDAAALLAARGMARQDGPAYLGVMKAIHARVAASGCHNYQQARVQLPSNLNLERWQELAEHHGDPMVAQYLRFGFPASYEGRQPDPAAANHSSARLHPAHVEHYISKEVKEGAILGPFSDPPFAPWCQVNALLTRPKKDSDMRRVIMDLSWPHPPLQSVNGGTPKETYMGEPFKLELPSPEDLCKHIREVGPGAYLYAADISRAYRQMPLCPRDWPLTCLKAEEGYYCDVSLPFGLRWAAACCQRATNLVARELQAAGSRVEVYIDDFAGAAPSKDQAQQDFLSMRALLLALGLAEAQHKASPPSQKMTWLGLEYNTLDMTMSIPPAKLKETLLLVRDWLARTSATKTQLKSILGKLFFVSQCSKPSRLFLNRMLATLRACPDQGQVLLGEEFKKDLNWFKSYLASTNGVFIIQKEEVRAPAHLYVDSSTAACGGFSGTEAYHHKFPQTLISRGLSICHLEAINAVAALKLWAPSLRGQLVHLHSDSATAVAIMQAGRGRNPFLQACAREAWVIAAINDLTLVVTHIPGRQLQDTADALSREHLGAPFTTRVAALLASGVTKVSMPRACFALSDSI